MPRAMKRLGAIVAAFSLLLAMVRCATSEDEPEHKVPGGYADSGNDRGGTGGTKTDAKDDSVTTGGTSSDASDAGYEEIAPDAPLDVSTDVPLDSPADVIDGSTKDVVDSGSTDKLLLVGRSASEVVLAEWDGQNWQKKSIVFAAASNPAIAASASGAVALVRRAADNELDFATWNPTSGWSGLTPVGTAGWTIGTPALAAPGDVHLIFQGTDYKYYANRYQAGAWLGFGPITAGSVQSFGPSPPAASASGSDVVIANEGSDHDLYTQTWSSGWQSAFAHGLLVKLKDLTPPAIAERTSNADTVVVYVEVGSKKLIWTAGKGSSWSSPTAIAGALSDDPASLSKLSNGSVACAFRGTDQKIYASIFAGTDFSAPAAVASAYPATAMPSIASGIGGHTSEVALVSGGAILVASLSGGVWTNPSTVATGNQAAVAITRFGP